MKKRWVFFIAAALAAAILLSSMGFADFGDFAGDSDWGGGYDSDWGGDYDSNWGSDWDDWGDSGYYSSSSGGGSLGGVATAVVIVIVIVVILGPLGKARFNPNGQRRVNVQPADQKPLVNDLRGLKERDPAFSESKFIEDAANLYVRMQNAWSAKDLTPVRTRLTAELYAKSERQVQSYISAGQTDHIERISVLNSNIVGCTKDDKNDIITLEFTARIIDYITDDKTGNVLRGSRSRELFMTYRWTFIRTIGRLTAVSGEVDTKHCPNCGAPIDLNQSAVCEYCGSVIESGDYDWVLSNIQGVSQKSN